MRFAEPVKDINPVEVKVLNGSQDVIMHLQELIYREEYFYKHEWEDGDIVIADNYTLLHGREAFEGSKQRYIQRINILPRAKKSFSRWLNNSLTIRRKEFFVAELPIFLIPLFLSINSFGDLLNPSLILGLIAIFLLFNIGDMINCYADYKLDSIYKSHLSNAVFELGKKQVLIQIVLSGLLAVGLTIYVALVNDLTYLIPLTIVGLFIGLQYSIKPLKFKSRGIWQYFGLWGIIFFGPMLYTSIIAGGWPPLWHLLIFALYGFVQTGIILLNTAEDYFEDISYGLNTIVVKLGLHRALYLGYHIVLWAGFALQIILAYMLTQLDYLLATSFIALSILGWVLVVKEYKLIYDSIEHKVEKEAIKTVQKNGMKVPIWLKRIAYSVLAVVLVYFIGNQIIMLYGKIL
jgi:4-hydroxybenzoate polyprenyltransferase